MYINRERERPNINNKNREQKAYLDKIEGFSPNSKTSFIMSSVCSNKARREQNTKLKTERQMKASPLFLFSDQQLLSLWVFVKRQIMR